MNNDKPLNTSCQHPYNPSRFQKDDCFNSHSEQNCCIEAEHDLPTLRKRAIDERLSLIEQARSEIFGG
jgi:hypothetical protein